MAFGDSSILDNFNRADEDPATGWGSSNNNIKVVSNGAIANVDNATCLGYWTAASFGADCEAFLTMTTVTTEVGDWGAVFARCQGETSAATLDGYLAQWTATAGTDELILSRMDNGSTTQLGSTHSEEMTNGDKLGVECIGSTIKMFRDVGAGWVETVSATDSTYGSAGRIIAGARDVETVLDDVGGGTLAAGTTPHGPLGHPLWGPLAGPVGA